MEVQSTSQEPSSVAKMPASGIVDPFFALKIGSCSCFCTCGPRISHDSHEIIFQKDVALVERRAAKNSRRHDEEDVIEQDISEFRQFSVHSPSALLRTSGTPTNGHTHGYSNIPGGSEDGQSYPRQQASARSQEGQQAALSLSSPPSSRTDFSGKWKLTSIEGDFDQFCADIGYGYLKRVTFKGLGYGVGLLTEEIRQDNSGDVCCMTVITVSPIRTVENTFRINGEKQDGLFADGESVEIVPRWDGDANFVDVYMNGKWLVSQRRSLAGGIHSVTIESASGNKVKRFFTKQ